VNFAFQAQRCIEALGTLGQAHASSAVEYSLHHHPQNNKSHAPDNHSNHHEHHSLQQNFLRVPHTPPQAAFLFPESQASRVDVIKPHATRPAMNFPDASEVQAMHFPNASEVQVAVVASLQQDAQLSQQQQQQHHHQQQQHQQQPTHVDVALVAESATIIVDSANVNSSTAPAMSAPLSLTSNQQSSIEENTLAGVGLTLKRNSLGMLCVRRVAVGGACDGDA